MPRSIHTYQTTVEYSEGAAAYTSGKPISSSPYRSLRGAEGAKEIAWQAGWLDGASGDGREVDFDGRIIGEGA